MRPDTVAHDSSLVRGYAWHVYPDPASAGALARDDPFSPPGHPDRGGSPPLPRGVVDFWTVGGKSPSLVNQVEGRAYLVLTDGPEPPAVSGGWFAEVARLEDDFEIDQRGDRSLRLIRVVNTVQTPSGPVQDCEFQVDRG